MVASKGVCFCCFRVASRTLRAHDVRFFCGKALAAARSADQHSQQRRATIEQTTEYTPVQPACSTSSETSSDNDNSGNNNNKSGNMKVPGPPPPPPPRTATAASSSSSLPPSSSSLFPSTAAAKLLFATGATVGPVVDSLHNQCLLRYRVLPVNLVVDDLDVGSFLSQACSSSSSLVSGGGDVGGSAAAAAAAAAHQSTIFSSSWTIPPLLGIAYVVLGGILPRLFQSLVVDRIRENRDITNSKSSPPARSSKSKDTLRTRALVAVVTTAVIIKLSELLQTHPSVMAAWPFFSGTNIILSAAEQHVFVLTIAALVQWAVLDGSPAALLAASAASIGGPLSELPFVGHGIWEYLPSAGDYLPLAWLDNGGGDENQLLEWVLGTPDYTHLALSSITGPCYFAVTMDAIALGRWFECGDDEDAGNGAAA